MSRLSRLWVALLLLALPACGQVEPVLVAVSMPDCAHQGATSMREGDVRLILRLDGLGDAGLVLVELTGDRDYEDLAEQLAATPLWSGPPSGTIEVASLRIEDGTGTDGVEETLAIDEGTYAVVCVDHSSTDGPAARPAAPLVVRAG